MIARFKKSKYEPKPIETDYWIDLQENEYGGVFKYYDYNAKVWKQTQSLTQEREPKFTSSAAFNISDTDIANWNSKIESSQLDAFKQDVYYMITTSGGVNQDTFDFELGLIKKELETKAAQATTLAGYGITNAYTKIQIDDKLKNLEIELPTNVSYFVNDAKYVTEDTLSSKLPEDIVSDPNYVHTDNNFTSTLKQKLESINLEPINNSINTLISKVSTNEQDILKVKQNNSNLQYSLGELTDTVSNKPNYDEVYTREYLDNIFNTFVRKTHRTYGFLDERPNDLEVTDTGFIFYDYSVNEPLIWVADRWRTLLSNEPIGWYLLDRDLTTSIGNWEFTEIGTDTCLLTKYVPSLDLDNDISQNDVFVPNTYSGMFTLEVGENTEDNYEYETITYEDKASYSYKYAIEAGTFSRPVTIYTPEEFRDKKTVTKLQPDQEFLSFSNVFNKESVRILSDNMYGNYTIPEDSTKISINSIQLSKGIKNINRAAFANVSPNDTVIDIPSGVNQIGDAAFINSELTSVSFPNNPYKINHQAFAYNKIEEVTFPSTMDYDHILNGGGWYMFALNTPELGMTVNIPNGTKALPPRAFYKTKIISEVSVPNSLIYIGSSVFYDSGIKGTFDSNKIQKIGAFSFRSNNLSSIIIRDPVIYLGAGAFSCSSSNSSVLNLTLGRNVEFIGNSCFYNYGNCQSEIILPDALKQIGVGAFYNYNTFVRNYWNLGEYWQGWYVGVNDLFKEYSNRDTLQLKLNDNLKYIGSGAFARCMCNGQLILPDSLVGIANNAFNFCLGFSNETLYIPKNVKYIGGTPYDAPWRLLYYPDYYPLSPNGYDPSSFAQYIEDGGRTENKGGGYFYLFAGYHLRAFEVDPENQWFKSVDGLLLSKDGSRLLAVPSQINKETLVIPEGVTCIDNCCINRNGMLAQYQHKRADGTFISQWVLGNSATYGDRDLSILGTQEVPLKYIQIPNSLKIRTPRELIRDFPLTCEPYGNELVQATYYSRVDKYIVKDDNPYYKNDGDWLLSKDGTELVALACGQKGDIYIPDSVTTILPGFTAIACYKNGSGEIKHLEDIDELVQNTDPYGHPAGSADGHIAAYRGIYLHIGPNVVNVSDYVLRELSSMNLTYGMGVYIDENNPAITINGKGWVVRKETAQ